LIAGNVTMALGQRLDRLDRGTEKLVGLVAHILELLTGNVWD
jgi:hypothetical protein